MPLVQKEIKAVYLGENKVRPAKKELHTCTIVWDEVSSPSSFFVRYEDDAAGLTPGDTAFDEFFGYYGCRLNTSGVETAKVTQEESGGAGKLDITQLGALTSGDNVMIAFPVMGIKMSKSGSTVTLSITKELNKSGYQYYAFNSNGTQKDTLYIGVYQASIVNNKLTSLSGATSIGGLSLDTASQAANSNGSRYHEETWYTRQLINAYYMMKYGNPNSQSVIGMGYLGSDLQTTGGTNSIDDATGATNTSSSGRIKLFGLEDWWGNAIEWLDGAYFSSGTNLQTSSAQAFNSYSSTAANNKISSYDKDITISGGWMSSIAGTNDGMFAGNAAAGGSSTYYCDVFKKYSSSGYLYVGGATGGSNENGIFYAGYGSSSYNWRTFGGRLICL